MKSFEDFILEAKYHNLLIEGPKPPDYNYEEAFVRLYNYLIGSEDKKSRVGKQIRSLIIRSRPGEDSAEQAGIMNDIVSLIAREVNKAEKDPNHPLHFNNIPNVGFNRGGKTPAHQTAYYEKLNGQKYTFLNLIRSKSGQKMGAQGLLAIRAGGEKTPLSPRGEKVYGKSSDTSKADVLFKDSSGEVVHTSSLKDVGGSVFASSGPEETKGNLLMGMYASLDSRLENNEIDQNEYDKLVERGTQLASEIALKMTTKGLSKEEEKKIINPEIDSRGLFKTMGDFEDSFPGVSEYVAKEQITGKGKYGQGVDSVLKTNKGGELIEFPEFLSTFVNQRFRTSKHGEKGNVSVAADAKKVDPDVERPGPDKEAYSKLTKSRLEKNLEAKIAKLEPETQAEVRSSLETGDMGVDELDALLKVDSKLKNFRQLRTDTQMRQAQQALSDAEDERKEAQRELETNSDGSKSYLQHQGQKRRNNPDLDARLTAADTAITTATNNLTDFRARAQAAEKPKPEPTKPEPTKPEAPKPEPQRTEPVDTAPKRQPEEPAKPEVSSPVTPKPQKKKEKKPVETSNGQLPQE
jgi:DNA-directed RNA polymerase subunit F